MTEFDKLQQKSQSAEKSLTEQNSKAKQQHLQQLDKVIMERDKLTKLCSEKDQILWDLNAKLEQSQKLVREMEDQMDKKKKKTKKGNECMECFKKEAEMQTLNARLAKLQNESQQALDAMTKQVRSKDQQIGDSQMLIKSLSEQMQQSI